MHSPSQSLWSCDGEEVHSVTLEFLFPAFSFLLESEEPLLFF